MCNSDQAAVCFAQGFNCSQAVFSTYCERLGLDPKTALKISCSFGGGMGRMGGTCGAVTGAYMLIGLKYGKYKAGDTASKEKTYALVREFTEKFKAVHGSVLCSELLGCDIGTDEGGKFAKENGLWDTLCPVFVRDAVRIVEGMLDLQDSKTD